MGGGGRYNNLIGQLSGTDLAAVGFGIGFDRTVEAAAACNLIPSSTTGPQVLVTVFSDALAQNSLMLTTALRAQNIRTELYPSPDKLGKQFKLAEQKKIRYVVVIGETEVTNGQLQLKDLQTGTEQAVTQEELITLVRSN